MKICPRCGKETMRDNELDNALSRRCDKYICHDCGADEAMEDAGYMSKVPLENWFCNIKF